MTQAYPHKEVQQPHLQQIVEDMTADESSEVAFPRFLAKGEISCEKIVHDQATRVSSRVGDVIVGEEQDETIDAIVDERTCRARDAEAHDAPHLLPYLRILTPVSFQSLDHNLPRMSLM